MCGGGIVDKVWVVGTWKVLISSACAFQPNTTTQPLYFNVVVKVMAVLCNGLRLQKCRHWIAKLSTGMAVLDLTCLPLSHQ